jgi:hypothetical protein
MKSHDIVSLRAGFAAAFAAALLAGCGLAETGASAATQATAAAEQVKQGKELEEKVKRDLAAAQQAEADSRAQAEEASQ